MDLKLAEFLMDSPFSWWVSLVSAMVLTVGAFSYISEKLFQEHNRRAIRNISGFIKRCFDELIKANRVDDQEPSPRNLKLIKWFEIGLYCLFSAWFYLYGITVLALIYMSQTDNLKLTLATLFVAVLIILANMYRVMARRARHEMFAQV